MDDIEKILEDNRHSLHDKSVINEEKAKDYLRKYWLNEEDYIKKYKPIQDKIFINQDKGLPEMIFNKGYQLLVSTGGCLFSKDDFEALKNSLLQIGETSIIIIQNTFGQKIDFVPFRMKFPATISWDELNDGDYISDVLIKLFYEEYFVFGESDLWGKYAATDYDYPFDILGCKANISSCFVPNFCPFIDDLDESGKEKLPEVYRKLST